jgi:hypothetical protein
MDRNIETSKQASVTWWIGLIALALVMNFGENIFAACTLGIFIIQVVAPILSKQPSWNFGLYTLIAILLLSAFLLIPSGALNVIFASKLSKQRRGLAAKVLGTVGAIMWFIWACVMVVALFSPSAAGAEPTLGTIATIWLAICCLLNAIGQLWAVHAINKKSDKSSLTPPAVSLKAP